MTDRSTRPPSDESLPPRAGIAPAPDPARAAGILSAETPETHAAGTTMPATPPQSPEATDDDTTDDEGLAAWLRLTLTPGVGPVTGQHLLRHLGPPDQIFRTPRSQLRALLNREGIVSALLADDPERERQIERTLAWRGGRRHLLALDDSRYPQALLHLQDPPLLIHAEGNLTALQRPHSIAMVGSRRASTEGLRNAFAFAEALARRGILITSGLAEGIDGAAHEGALAGAASQVPGTIAVLGNGIDRIYPSQNRRLAGSILARHGLILSEMPLGSAPTRAGFPRRNRLIAALSQAVLVVEAAMQSGSLITARLATELGRDVMAIPGSIHNPQARGCHNLIRQGAQLVDCVDDILQAMGIRDTGAQAPAAGTAAAAVGFRPTDEGRQLLACLGSSPQSTDTLASQLGWPAAQVLVTVQLLEMTGQVCRQADGRWQRMQDANPFS